MLNTYRVDPAPAPAAVRTVPVCELALVAVRLLIHTSSKSTLIRLTIESEISMFSSVNAPVVLPG